MRITLMMLITLPLFADSQSAAERAVKDAADRCRQGRRECTVSATYEVTGWLWKDGRPVNSAVVTVTEKVSKPKPPAKPRIEVIGPIYPSGVVVIR